MTAIACRPPTDVEHERLRLNQAAFNLQTAGLLTRRMEDAIQAQIRAILHPHDLPGSITDDEADAILWLTGDSPAPSERWMKLYKVAFNP